jgi:hypothetical protein
MGALKKHPKRIDVEGLGESEVVLEISYQNILDFRSRKGPVRDGSEDIVVRKIHVARSWQRLQLRTRAWASGIRIALMLEGALVSFAASTMGQPESACQWPRSLLIVLPIRRGRWGSRST